MKIKFEAGRGRFAVSARDIEVGELIAVENAFVALIDKVLMEFRTCREVIELPNAGSNPESLIRSPINYLNIHEFLTLNSGFEPVEGSSPTSPIH